MAVMQVERFEVLYSSNQFAPRIALMHGNNFVGQLFFKPDGVTLPADGIVNGLVYLYYHLSDFRNIMELLRSDKGTWLSYGGAAAENSIRTSPDLVGAGELVHPV